MTCGIWSFYPSALEALLDGKIRIGEHARVVLLADTYKRDSNQRVWSDIMDHEIEGTGYEAGGLTIEIDQSPLKLDLSEGLLTPDSYLRTLPISAAWHKAEFSAQHAAVVATGEDDILTPGSQLLQHVNLSIGNSDRPEWERDLLGRDDGSPLTANGGSFVID